MTGERLFVLLSLYSRPAWEPWDKQDARWRARFDYAGGYLPLDLPDLPAGALASEQPFPYALKIAQLKRQIGELKVEKEELLWRLRRVWEKQPVTAAAAINRLGETHRIWVARGQGAALTSEEILAQRKESVCFEVEDAQRFVLRHTPFSQMDDTAPGDPWFEGYNRTCAVRRRRAR